MEFKVRWIGAAAILDLEGRLTIETSVEPVLRKMKSLQEQGVNRFVLNLADVKRWDCSGIGQLVRLYVELRASGGRLRLLNPGKEPKLLLEIFELHKVLEAFDQERAAVASFDESDQAAQLHTGLRPGRRAAWGLSLPSWSPGPRSREAGVGMLRVAETDAEGPEGPSREATPPSLRFAVSGR